MPAPTVFISYSHDSQEHKDWTLALATALRGVGIDAVLDQWDLVPGQDLATFMVSGIRNADRVLLICSEAYVTKAQAGAGGVGYERLIVTSEVVAAIDTIKFIPVVRNNVSVSKVPDFLGARLYIDFNDDAQFAVRLEELARAIHSAPAAMRPALGENPFKGEVIASGEPVRVASASGAMPTGEPILSDAWFHTQHQMAARGITMLHQDSAGQVPSVNSVGSMEVRFGLHSGLNKSQIELLNAVRQSKITTFGWPFAVLFEGREEYSPRPLGDGIRAEVSINERERKSYDYWAARKSGDLYAMQSFFEDQRADGPLFFNTRIVRVTEALLFASKLYVALGAAPDAKISVRFTHRGLAGRTLKSSNVSRMLFNDAKSHEQVSETETVLVLEGIQSALVDEVERVCAPMFMLFEFQEFGHSIYEDIVHRFEKGEVS